MKPWRFALVGAGLLLVLEVIAATIAWTPLAVTSDPLVRMPGTQPNQVSLEAPSRCMNCHANYNSQVEQGFNWQGSMMAHAARDFLFWACLTVASQDSIHALGRPNAADICVRCHFPQGWLEGRSDPFFAKLKAWGNTIWQIWENNKNVPGAAPVLMVQASLNIDNPCNPPVPALLDAEPGDGTTKITWSNVHTTDLEVIGYRVYYDQAGKSQLVTQVGLTTTYTDTGLLVGQRYCYKVTSLYTDCESDYSNVVCVTSAPLVSIGDARGLEDGSWVFVRDAIVTAGKSLGWGFLFASAPERHSGIRFFTSEGLEPGQRPRLTGIVSRVDGEWYAPGTAVYVPAVWVRGPDDLTMHTQ